MNISRRTRKPLSASAAQHIQAELRKLEARGLCLKQSGRLFVRCPFHHEKTPSCIVTTNVQSKYEIGSFKCLGCGEGGDWNKLAKEMGLAEINEFNNVAKTVVKYDTKFYDRLLEERYDTYSSVLEDLELSKPTELPDKGEWRSLPYTFLKQHRICMTKGPKGKYLFMPTYMGGEVVGGIRAVLTPSGDKGEIKYKNSSGEWSREKGLYPYDETSKRIDAFEKEYGFRGLALVEGARDSLCFNCEGIPTLGILGTQSWCAAKMDRILDLDVDFLLICMDGDKAGRQAEEKIWEDVRGVVPCRKMNLSRFSRLKKKDIDPGNAPPDVLAEVWQTMHKRKNQPVG